MVHALFRTKRQWSQIRSLHGFEMEIYRHLLHMLVSMVAFSFVVSWGTLWTFGRPKVLPRHAESTPWNLCQERCLFLQRSCCIVLFPVQRFHVQLVFEGTPHSFQRAIIGLCMGQKHKNVDTSISQEWLGSFLGRCCQTAHCFWSVARHQLEVSFLFGLASAASVTLNHHPLSVVILLITITISFPSVWFVTNRSFPVQMNVVSCCQPLVCRPRLCYHPLMELVNANHFVTLAGVGYLKSRVYGYRDSAAQLSRGQWGFGRPSKGYHGKM